MTTSQSLEAANQRLHALQAQARKARVDGGLPVDHGPAPAQTNTRSHESGHIWDIGLQAAVSPTTDETAVCHYGKAVLDERRAAAGVDYCPPATPDGRFARECLDRAAALQQQLDSRLTLPDVLPVYPALLTAVLQAGDASAARVLLLLHLLDRDGCGWLDLDQLRAVYADPDSRYYVFTWRRWRQILNAGDGRYWKVTHNGRVRYRAPWRIMVTLDAGKLQGDKVMFPAAVLFNGLKKYKAYILDAFHSGRPSANPDDENDNFGAPITRQTLRKITGVSESTQREYHHLTAVRRRSNIAITNEKYAAENVENRTWEHGFSVFKFNDFRGRQRKIGLKPGDEVIAWRLPNSYEGSLATAAAGRKKKLNRMIGLVTIGARGSGAEIEQLYHPDSAAAGVAFNRSPEHDHYFAAGAIFMPRAIRPSKLAGAGVWGVITRE